MGGIKIKLSCIVLVECMYYFIKYKYYKCVFFYIFVLIGNSKFIIVEKLYVI